MNTAKVYDLIKAYASMLGYELDETASGEIDEHLWMALKIPKPVLSMLDYGKIRLRREVISTEWGTNVLFVSTNMRASDIQPLDQLEDKARDRKRRPVIGGVIKNTDGTVKWFVTKEKIHESGTVTYVEEHSADNHDFAEDLVIMALEEMGFLIDNLENKNEYLNARTTL